jgi:hypothetical protein
VVYARQKTSATTAGLFQIGSCWFDSEQGALLYPMSWSYFDDSPPSSRSRSRSASRSPPLDIHEEEQNAQLPVDGKPLDILDLGSLPESRPVMAHQRPVQSTVRPIRSPPTSAASYYLKTQLSPRSPYFDWNAAGSVSTSTETCPLSASTDQLMQMSDVEICDAINIGENYLSGAYVDKHVEVSARHEKELEARAIALTAALQFHRDKFIESQSSSPSRSQNRPLAHALTQTENTAEDSSGPHCHCGCSLCGRTRTTHELITDRLRTILKLMPHYVSYSCPNICTSIFYDSLSCSLTWPTI